MQTQDLRGRIIGAAIDLEDKMDFLILNFLNPIVGQTAHQQSVNKIIDKHFIQGKTFGSKIGLLKDFFKSEVFKEKYFITIDNFELFKIISNTPGYTSYEKAIDHLLEKFRGVLEIRNTAAHGKLNYDIIKKSPDEIKEVLRDREFLNKGKLYTIDKSKENQFYKDIDDLKRLVDHCSIVIMAAHLQLD